MNTRAALKSGIVFIAALQCTFMWAQASTVVTNIVETNKGSQEQKISISADKIRFDGLLENKNQSFIFRADKEVFWLLNNADKTYVQFTAQELETVLQQMENLRLTLATQLQHLPVQQKKNLEKLVPSFGIEEKTTYRLIAAKSACGKFQCEYFEGMRDGKKVHDVWIATPQSLGFSAPEMLTVGKLGDFFTPLMRFFKGAEGVWFVANKSDNTADVKGLPVKMVFPPGGKVKKQELARVEHAPLAQKVFEIPEGFQKTLFKLY